MLSQVASGVRTRVFQNSGFSPFTARWPHPVGSPSLPFYVRFNLALFGATLLLAKMQHSILSTWLTHTQAGFAPASHQKVPIRSCIDLFDIAALTTPSH